MSRHGALKLVYIPDYGSEEVLALLRADEHTIITIDVKEPHYERPATEIKFIFGAPSPK
jgi:hypothetical protein